MNKIKKIKLAEILGVSRAAITKAVASGILVSDGGLIDIDDPVNKYYIAGKGIILSEKEVNNMPKKTNMSEKQKKNTLKTMLTSDEVADFIARKKKADAEYAELKNQKMRGELIDAEMVHDYIFLFLDKVSNNLQRNAASYLSDVADKIVSENGLTSAIRNQWQTMVLNQFDTAKKEVIKKLSQVKEKQNV
jgi:phage terminase Nu1 subunit (DNA packaging protein)